MNTSNVSSLPIFAKLTHAPSQHSAFFLSDNSARRSRLRLALLRFHGVHCGGSRGCPVSRSLCQRLAPLAVVVLNESPQPVRFRSAACGGRASRRSLARARCGILLPRPPQERRVSTVARARSRVLGTFCNNSAVSAVVRYEVAEACAQDHGSKSSRPPIHLPSSSFPCWGASVCHSGRASWRRRHPLCGGHSADRRRVQGGDMGCVNREEIDVCIDPLRI